MSFLIICLTTFAEHLLGQGQTLVLGDSTEWSDKPLACVEFSLWLENHPVCWTKDNVTISNNKKENRVRDGK